MRSAQIDEAREMSGMVDSVDTEEYINLAMVMESNPDLEKKIIEFMLIKYNPTDMLRARRSQQALHYQQT